MRSHPAAAQIQLETAYAAIRFARQNGVRTIRSGARRRNLDMGVVTQASFLMPNETELAILTGMAVESEAEVSAAAQSLVEQGIEPVIVTLGGPGALLATHEGARPIAPVRSRRSTPPAPATRSSAASPATSPPGLRSMRLSRTNRYSALSVTRHGAQKSFAPEAEFEAFCSKLG